MRATRSNFCSVVTYLPQEAAGLRVRPWVCGQCTSFSRVSTTPHMGPSRSEIDSDIPTGTWAEPEHELARV